MEIDLDQMLVDEFGLASADEATRTTVLKQLGQALFLRLGRRLMGDLEEEERQNLDEVAAEDSNMAAELLANRFPNFNDILKEEIAGMKEEFQSLMG